jgi:hypothetical protein
MELRKKLGIPVIISAVLLMTILHQISQQQSEKIYGETTTVIGKSYCFVERYYMFPVGTPVGGEVWRRSSHRGIFWVHKIITSSGNEYEIILKDDWDIIQEDDVIKQFTGSPYTVERGSGIYYESIYAPIPGILCWLELWRNGTCLEDLKAYKPP